MAKKQISSNSSLFNVDINFLYMSYKKNVIQEHQLNGKFFVLQAISSKYNALLSFTEWFEQQSKEDNNVVKREDLNLFKEYLISLNFKESTAKAYKSCISSILKYMVRIGYLSYNEQTGEFSIRTNEENTSNLNEASQNINNNFDKCKIINTNDSDTNDADNFYQYLINNNYSENTIKVYFSNIRYIIKLMLNNGLLNQENKFMTCESLKEIKDFIESNIENKTKVCIYKSLLNTLSRYISENGYIDYNSFLRKEKKHNKNTYNRNTEAEYNNVETSVISNNGNSINESLEENKNISDNKLSSFQTFSSFKEYLDSSFKKNTVNVYLSNIRCIIRYMFDNKIIDEKNITINLEQLKSFKDNQLKLISDNAAKQNALVSSINILIGYVSGFGCIEYTEFLKRKTRCYSSYSEINHTSDDLSNKSSVEDDLLENEYEVNNGNAFNDNNDRLNNDDSNHDSINNNDDCLSKIKDELENSKLEECSDSKFEELKERIRQFEGDNLFDPFKFLDVKPDDEQEFIKKQYRKLALLCHPDHNDESKEAKFLFILINKSYKMVTNEELCSIYTSYINAVENCMNFKSVILQHKLKNMIDEMMQA